MNEIIKIEKHTIGDEEVNSINSRELYENMGLDKSNWSRWIKKNIEDSPLATENKDYIRFSENISGNITDNFVLTTNFAIQLLMMCNNKKCDIIKKYISNNVNLSMEDILNQIIDIDTPCDDMYVYAIQEKYSKRIKIGISRNPEERIKQLNTGNPEPLTLIDKKLAPNKFKDEQKIHNKFNTSRLNGEWFSLDNKQIENVLN